MSAVKGMCLPLLALVLVSSIEAEWGPGSIGCCPPGTPPECPVQPCDDYFNLFPHPNDCSFFIHCDAGRKPVCKQCPAGLHFNPELRVCDWPENAGCEGGPSKPPSTTCTPTPTPSTTTTPCTSTTTPRPTTTPCTTTTPCSTTTVSITTTTPPPECFGDEC